MSIPSLAGKTLFITGASRGIGKAIALRAAKDGAKIVIAAKTADPSPKLPGTIYTAAKDIENEGGKCLPCIVDVREEDQVQGAVDQAVKHFGGIDILINNASAINLTGTLGLPMKRYDLMMSINTRGTYLVSKLCLPYLLKSSNPHILNISPPLNMTPHWFKNHVAYTMAKYGMSMCVLGMAEEFRSDGIAVNALWPKTAIYTAAMEMLGGSEIKEQCRTEEIMSDAAHVILTRNSHEATGNFFIDEEVLRETGVVDFDRYSVKPGHPLLPDFFLDMDPETLVKQMEELGAKPAFTPSSESKQQLDSSSSGNPEVEQIFTKIQGLLSTELVQSTAASYHFDLKEDGKWFLDMKTGEGSVGKGESASPPDTEMIMSSENFVKMFTGKLKPAVAFMSGKLKIKGDMGKAMKLEKLMGKLQSKL